MQPDLSPHQSAPGSRFRHVTYSCDTAWSLFTRNLLETGCPRGRGADHGGQAVACWGQGTYGGVKRLGDSGRSAASHLFPFLGAVKGGKAGKGGVFEKFPGRPPPPKVSKTGRFTAFTGPATGQSSSLLTPHREHGRRVLCLWPPWSRWNGWSHPPGCGDAYRPSSVAPLDHPAGPSPRHRAVHSPSGLIGMLGAGYRCDVAVL